jgi:hypothetical protein
MATTYRDSEMNTETNRKLNGEQKRKPRVVSHQNEIAGIVMMQIDQVNSKKDELTIAIKNLADTTKQLVRAYAGVRSFRSG